MYERDSNFCIKLIDGEIQLGIRLRAVDIGRLTLIITQNSVQQLDKIHQVLGKIFLPGPVELFPEEVFIVSTPLAWQDKN